MKYNININQKSVIDNKLNLDAIDCIIFDFIKDFSITEKCKKMQDNGRTYFWIKWSLIVDNLPIIKISTRRGIINRMENLKKESVVIPHEENQKLSTSWFTFGKNADLLLFQNDKQPVHQLYTPVNEIAHTPVNEIAHTPVNEIAHNNIHNIDNNNNNDILSSSKNENEIEQPKKSLENDIKEIVVALNENAQTEYRDNAKKTQTLLKSLLLDYKKEVIINVIIFKCKEWINTEYEKYLRPDTLFGNKFEGYAQQAKIAKRVNAKIQTPPPLPKEKQEETEFEKALKNKYYKK